MTVSGRARRTSRGVLVAVGTALVASAGCGELGAPEPATEQGESVIDLWRALLVAASLLGAVVVVLATIAVVRFRRRPGDGDELPDQGHGNALLEAVYVAIPLGVVIGFFAYTLHIDDLVTRPADDPAVELEVTGYRWGWRFEYPAERVVIESIAGEEPTIVLPVDTDVRFRLESTDVIHSFFVPEFLTKRDLVPGLVTDLDVRLTRTGRFLGHCAEYCGLDHARMNFAVEVVDRPAYDRWLTTRRDEA